MSDTYNIDITKDELNLIVDALVEYDENQPCNVYCIDIPTLVSKLNNVNKSAPKYTFPLPPSTTCPMATSYTSSIPSTTATFTLKEGYYYNGRFYEDENHIIPIYAKTDEIYVDLHSDSNMNYKCYRYDGSKFIRIASSKEAK